MVRRGLISIGVILVVMLIVASAGYYLFTQPPEIAAEITPVAVTAEATQSFDGKIEAFSEEVNAASKAGERRQVRLAVTDEEATSKLNQLATEGETPVKLENIQVNFRDDKVYALVEVEVLGISVKVGVKALVEAKEGKLEINLEEIDLGRLPVPGAIRNRIVGFTEEIENLEFALPIYFEDIHTEDGQLVMEGITQ